MSKIRCMRTSSKAPRTCLDMPHSFRSPFLAVICRRHDSMAPNPELSMNRTRLRSSTTFVLAWSTGAISRLSSEALLASSSSTGTATAATSPILSTVSFIGVHSFLFVLAILHKRNAVPSALVAVVPHLVHAPGDHIGPEPGLPGAVQHWRRQRRRIEALPQVLELQDNRLGESSRFHVDRLVGTAMVGVQHD